MFFAQAITALSEANARYCVVGGLAVSMHGIPRTTYDLDIVAVPTAENLERVDGALRSLGLTPKLPIALADLADAALREEWRAARNLIAVSYADDADPLRLVDVLVSPPVASIEDLVARARAVAVGRMTVPLASVEDLVEMKRNAGRPQDLADVVHLERLLGRSA